MNYKLFFIFKMQNVCCVGRAVVTTQWLTCKTHIGGLSPDISAIHVVSVKECACGIMWLPNRGFA